MKTALATIQAVILLEQRAASKIDSPELAKIRSDFGEFFHNIVYFAYISSEDLALGNGTHLGDEWFENLIKISGNVHELTPKGYSSPFLLFLPVGRGLPKYMSERNIHPLPFVTFFKGKTFLSQIKFEFITAGAPFKLKKMITPEDIVGFLEGSYSKKQVETVNIHSIKTHNNRLSDEESRKILGDKGYEKLFGLEYQRIKNDLIEHGGQKSLSPSDKNKERRLHELFNHVPRLSIEQIKKIRKDEGI